MGNDEVFHRPLFQWELLPHLWPGPAKTQSPAVPLAQWHKSLLCLSRAIYCDFGAYNDILNMLKTCSLCGILKIRTLLLSLKYCGRESERAVTRRNLCCWGRMLQVAVTEGLSLKSNKHNSSSRSNQHWGKKGKNKIFTAAPGGSSGSLKLSRELDCVPAFALHVTDQDLSGTWMVFLCIPEAGTRSSTVLSGPSSAARVRCRHRDPCAFSRFLSFLSYNIFLSCQSLYRHPNQASCVIWWFHKIGYRLVPSPANDATPCWQVLRRQGH